MLEEKTDSYGRSEKEIYDELEKDFPISKGFGKVLDENDELTYEYYFLEDDANELLANIGLDQNLNYSEIPRDKLLRIFRYYHQKSEKKLENGKKSYVDPLPDYRAGTDSFENEIKKFGYELGKVGEIGIYYRLLPDDNFRHGYWQGKMERAVELDDDNIILEVSKEIKIYDAMEAENELGNIVNSIFTEEHVIHR